MSNSKRMYCVGIRSPQAAEVKVIAVARCVAGGVLGALGQIRPGDIGAETSKMRRD